MTIQDFMLHAERAVTSYLRGERQLAVDVGQAEFVKANDNRVYGLRITVSGANAGWTVYMNDLYERYEEGEDIDTLMTEASARCEAGLGLAAPVTPEDLQLDFDNIKERLTVRLLGVRNNMSYMAGRPYIDAGCGLALIAVIGCDRSSRNEWFLSVTDDLLTDEIKCSREELLTAALENTMKKEPPLFVCLSDYVIANCAGSFRARNYLEDPYMDESKKSGSFMLTNESTFFGAAVLFYPGIMERVSEILGCGYYVLPSSVHEVMIIPESADPDVQQMIETVREANATVIEKEELLSDNVMHYDIETGELSVVTGRRKCDNGEKSYDDRRVVNA